MILLKNCYTWYMWINFCFKLSVLSKLFQQASFLPLFLSDDSLAVFFFNKVPFSAKKETLLLIKKKSGSSNPFLLFGFFHKLNFLLTLILRKREHKHDKIPTVLFSRQTFIFLLEGLSRYLDLYFFFLLSFLFANFFIDNVDCSSSLQQLL